MVNHPDNKMHDKFVIPNVVKPNVIEDERKYKIILEGEDNKSHYNDDVEFYNNLTARIKKLEKIFEFVLSHTNHFQTLDIAPHREDFSEPLRKLLSKPVKTTVPRSRLYWGDDKMSGVDPKTGKSSVEIRSERKIDKGCYEQVVKITHNGDGKTLSRDENEIKIDGPGVNLEAFPKKARAELKALYSNQPLKPLSRISGQSTMILYNPDGNKDILLEIKFDKQIGETFDGFKWPVVEVEVEIKSMQRALSAEQKDEFLQLTEDILMAAFQHNLECTSGSKATLGNKHLLQWKNNDPKGFKRAVANLRRDEFTGNPKSRF